VGLLYSAFTYHAGFKVNSGEYKVMGLAPYGEPRYVQAIYDHLIDVKPDGTFRLNMEFFDYCTGLTMTNDRFGKLFGGPPREPESRLTQREMDLARSIQDVTEDIMMRLTRTLHRETGERNLCMAGGVALNCVGNGRILREGPFDGIWIQPAAGDAGGALGAALAAWHRFEGKPRNVDGVHDTMRGSFLGPSFTDNEVERFLHQRAIPYERLSDDEFFETYRGRHCCREGDCVVSGKDGVWSKSSRRAQHHWRRAQSEDAGRYESQGQVSRVLSSLCTLCA
jgi:carbamoyltransferase